LPYKQVEEKGLMASNKKRPSGPEQAAEKGQMLNEKPEKRPSGAKDLVDLIALAARLKSCPDASCPFERLFPQPVKALLILRALCGG
jgi:hypothetical protein